MFAAMQASVTVMALAVAVVCASIAVDIWTRRR